jgi:glucose/mannose transport system substrate-binding protein
LLLLFVSSCQRSVSDSNQERDFFEIASWWTAEGEFDALRILQDKYSKSNPQYSVLNSNMAGGAGTIARVILSDRLSEGNPPDVFQSLMGRGLIASSVQMGQLEPLGFLYEQYGWSEVMHPVILDALTYRNEFYAVPLTIHRSNLIWYRPDVFEKAGVSVPESMEQLLEVCDILAENGIIPISLGDKLSWTALHLYENILLSIAGPEKYGQFWKGELSFWDEDIRISLIYFDRLLEYSNSDHAALSWDDALRNVAAGNAGISVIGDWADSNLVLSGYTRGEDFAWAVFPGTDGIYNWLSDGFCLPKGVGGRDAAIEWLKLCGSKEGQEEFNYYKSSLPVRTDVDVSSYSEYQLFALEDFNSSTLVGSLCNGVLVSDKVWTRILEIVSDFIFHRDTDRCQQELEDMRQAFYQ